MPNSSLTTSRLDGRERKKVRAKRLKRSRPSKNDQHFAQGFDRDEVCAERRALSSGEERLHAFFEEGVRSEIKLSQLHKYAGDVYGLFGDLASVCDTRIAPSISTFSVLNALFHAAVLRIPSLHDLESLMREPRFQRVVGHRVKKGRAEFSDSSMARVLDSVDVSSLRSILSNLVLRAYRNKSFRDDIYGDVRTVAIDGWEAFTSYERHCPGCLSRMVRVSVQDSSGDEVVVKRRQYFHRFVVAMQVAPTMDIILDIEPVGKGDVDDERDKDLDSADTKSHEGELSAAKRLLYRLKRTYGGLLEVLVLDALYANGPMFTLIESLNLSACVVTKKKGCDPLRFANSIWEHRGGPDARFVDTSMHESIDFYTLDSVDALQSFDGSVDMVKALVRKTRGKKKKKPGVWAYAKVGKKAKRLSPRVSLQVLRARWHIENNAFHQWATKWNLDRCFRHSPNAIEALMLIWMIAFNLMQLFIYRRLGYKKKRKSYLTLQSLYRELMMDVGSYREAIPWERCLFNDSG